MKNFSIKHEGKEYWISRSIAVVGVIIAAEEDKWYVLVNKRGKGAADFQGLWNLPCGYLDYNENINEACSREILEECGVSIDPTWLRVFNINSSPLENRQNVSVKLFAFAKSRVELGPLSGEKDEVEDVMWMPIEAVTEKEWAFNHQYLINEVVSYGREIQKQQRDSQQTPSEISETTQPDSSL